MSIDPKKRDADMALLGFQTVIILCLLVTVLIVAASKGLI